MILAVFVIFFDLFATVMNGLILARIIISWVAPESSLYRTVSDLTEPVLAPVRKMLPRMGMIDISPMVTLLLLNLAVELVHILISRLV